MFSTIISLGEALALLAKNRGNVDDAVYSDFRKRFAADFWLKATDNALFTTDVTPEALWDAYIGGFPAHERQYHNCGACRRFIQHYGGLVTIDERGAITPALWEVASADIDAIAFSRLRRLVKGAQVTGVFLSPTKRLGEQITGKWAHLSVEVPARRIHVPGAMNAHQKMAEKKQDHAQVMAALGEFTRETVEKALAIVQSEALYRSEKIAGQIEFLAKLHSAGGARTRLAWRAVATAPAGFCHPRSSMVGTLLEDLASGMNTELVAKRFAAKMHPLSYQRPTAPPKVGAIQAAEKLFAELGLAESLPRRFATLADVQKLWQPAADKKPEGVFGHLMTRAGEMALSIPGEKKLTWEKFRAEVIPKATAIDLLAPTMGNYCALMTAETPDAPPILQWDDPAQRNRVSWYLYSGGSLASRWRVSPVWTKVTAVTLQPNMWITTDVTPRNERFSHQGEGALFLLEGCRDTGWRQAGGGLFPETLRSELHGVRSVIEEYSRLGTISGYEQSNACGLKITKGNDMNVRLRVTSGATTAVYLIDRWD